MLVKYTPENDGAREWEFNPKRVRQSDAEMIEKRFGGDWADFVKGVQANSPRARKVLLWHLLRQEHHTLRFEDVPDFFMGELDVDYSIDELKLLRAEVVKSTSVDEQKREEALVQIDAELASRGEYLDLGAEELGKADSSTDG